MLMQPVPFQPLQGPNGWRLDLMPMPHVGMAAQSIEGYLTCASGKPKMGASGPQPAWRKRLGRFTVWGWFDGSIAVKPLSGAPVPFPMWLHHESDKVYPPVDQGDMPNVDLDWLRQALVHTAALVHGTAYAAIEAGTLGPDRWPAWWANGRHPHAHATDWNPILDDAAVLAAAWFRASGKTAPIAVPFSVWGGLLLPDGTVQPATFEESGLGTDLQAFLHAAMKDVLGSLDAVAIAWSATMHVIQSPTGHQRTAHLPCIIPAPITLVTRTLPNPSAHLVLEIQHRLQTCTG